MGSESHAQRIKNKQDWTEATLKNKIPYCTNMSTALACIEGIRALKSIEMGVTPIQNI